MTWKNVVNLENLEFETREFNTLETKGKKYEIAPAACAESMGAKKLGFNVGTNQNPKFMMGEAWKTPVRLMFNNPIWRP